MVRNAVFAQSVLRLGEVNSVTVTMNVKKDRYGANQLRVSLRQPLRYKGRICILLIEQRLE